MDAFGWSTQPAPAAPSDDALLAAFLGSNTFEELHCDGAGDGTVISDVYGALGLPPCQSDLSLLRWQNGVTLSGRGDPSSNVFLDDSVGLLPGMAGAQDGFAFPNVHVEPAQADGSNTAFSGYSTTTGGGGGNISSGESNTYGSGDTEVASPCAMSRSSPVLPQPRTTLPPTKKKLPDKYPVAKETATTTTRTSTTSITFGQSGGGRRGYEPDTEAIAQVKEMVYRAAAMRPVSLGAGPGEPPSSTPPDQPSSWKPRRRKNVRISSDPQTVAARLRRERVSERLRALQRLVPGGSKMDTASMLDEAASYLRFLKSQVAALETLGGGGRGVDDDGRYSSPLQRYVGRNFGLSSRGGGGGGTVLAFGRDGVPGYVKSNRNMQL